MKKVVILTDGGKGIGFGHLIRCSSIYDALVLRGFDVRFFIAGDNSVLEFLSNRKHILRNWHKEFPRLIDELLDYDVVILDSLTVSQNQVFLLCEQRFTLVSIDDFLRNLYKKAIIVDWTLGCESTHVHQKNELNNKLLLGVKYAALRKPFWESFRPDTKEVSKVLITLGGSDIRNLTPRLTADLSKNFPEISFYSIIGPGSNDKYFENQLNISNVHMCKPQDAQGMFNLMADSDIVISSGGQTLYELASLAKPTIAVEMVENQKEDIAAWSDKGLVYNSVRWDDVNLIEEISNSLHKLMDISLRKEIVNRVWGVIPRDGLFGIINEIETTLDVSR